MEYKTSDLNLAAYLKAKYNLKIKNLESDSQEAERALFVFIIESAFKIEKCIAEYYNGDDVCSINAFTREASDLRSWIRNFKTNREINKNA